MAAKMLQKSDLETACADFVEHSAANFVQAEQAIRKDITGMRIYDPPLLGVASAHDPIFESFHQTGIIGPHFNPPLFWLPEAVSVLSFFLPFTHRVRQANLKDPSCPNPEWANARWEGQSMVNALCRHLEETLRQAGHLAMSPCLDERFHSKGQGIPRFNSNWSERHIAHACGLGTFGLSAGLITAKGMAGRFGSLLTSLKLPPDARPYQSYNAYCSRCGACAQRCPVTAISLEKGKEHTICSPLVDKSMEPYRPRYGCGKCQVGVPCEKRIPPRRRDA